jgi:hypothetical protein
MPPSGMIGDVAPRARVALAGLSGKWSKILGTQFVWPRDCRQNVDKPFGSIGTIGILNRLEGRFLSCFESNRPQ